MEKQVELQPAEEQEEEEVRGQPRMMEGRQVRRQREGDPDITIFCSLCKDYLVHSVTTSCEHTFCELCLNEYTLFIDECPECRAKLRHLRQVNNILLDNLILDYIKQYEPQDKSDYEKRLEEYKDFKKKRRYLQLYTA